MTQSTIAQMSYEVIPQNHASSDKNYINCFIIFGAIIGAFVVISVLIIIKSGISGQCASPATESNYTAMYDIQQQEDFSTTENETVTDPASTAVPPSDPAPTFNGATKFGMEWGKQQILQQYRELHTVGCRPTTHVMHIQKLLAPEDALFDKKFNPEWVVVGRCLPSCSYCRSPLRCLPTQGSQRNKTFVVLTTENNKRRYHKRRVVEDTACSCQ
nr:uncharacterized protein LOC128696775 [Cherax quadricarinatus]